MWHTCVRRQMRRNFWFKGLKEKTDWKTLDSNKRTKLKYNLKVCNRRTDLVHDRDKRRRG